jgi:hypothetical protein
VQLTVQLIRGLRLSTSGSRASKLASYWLDVSLKWQVVCVEPWSD